MKNKSFEKAAEVKEKSIRAPQTFDRGKGFEIERKGGKLEKNSPRSEVIKTPEAKYKELYKDERRKSSSVTDQLKEYIDEIDGEIYRETGIKVIGPPKNKTEVVIIDVEKASQISGKKKKKKIGLGKKIKALASKKIKKSTKNEKNKQENRLRSEEREWLLAEKARRAEEQQRKEEEQKEREREENLRNTLFSPSPRIRETIATLERQANKSPEMIHSSQQPVEKLPLTKGRTVDTMVKRLSIDTGSPPPKPNVMVAPNVAIQHNNNKPFSYIRGLSPEKMSPPKPSSPVIYAQVVCGNQNGESKQKQTVHMSYTNGKKNVPHSDSDEGLGFEDFGRRNDFSREKTITRFGDEEDSPEYEENPITPKFRYNSYGYHKQEEPFFYMDSSSRGRGDGVESKRRESLTENGLETKRYSYAEHVTPHNKIDVIARSELNKSREFGYINGRSDLSARRDLLESRINSRQFGTIEKNPRRESTEFKIKKKENSPPSNVYLTTTTTESSRYYRTGSTSPTFEEKKYYAESTTRRGSDEKKTIESKFEKRCQANHTKIYQGDEKVHLGNTKNYNERKRDSYDIDEPKSFESHGTDYRSSPENRYRSKVEKKQSGLKNRDYYRSNPEISYDDGKNIQSR